MHAHLQTGLTLARELEISGAPPPDSVQSSLGYAVSLSLYELGINKPIRLDSSRCATAPPLAPTVGLLLSGRMRTTPTCSRAGSARSATWLSALHGSMRNTLLHASARRHLFARARTARSLQQQLSFRLNHTLRPPF